MSKNITIANNDNAYIAYRISDNVLIVDKTYVDPKLRGQNMGKKLYKELIKFVRSNGLKFKSNCSYITKIANEDENVKDFFIK